MQKFRAAALVYRRAKVFKVVLTKAPLHEETYKKPFGFLSFKSL